MKQVITLTEAYGILESLYPRHFTIYNAYTLNKDIDKDILNLEKWDELYESVLEIEDSFGIHKIENRISKYEQILQYYDHEISDIPPEYVVSVKEKIKDLKAEIQLLTKKLTNLQNDVKFEIYEDLINE